jgi:hypothetical protein
MAEIRAAVDAAVRIWGNELPCNNALPGAAHAGKYVGGLYG